MNIFILKSKQQLGQRAALTGAGFIRDAIEHRGEANIILATGASQFEMLTALVNLDVDWTRVNGFHLDEYIDLPADHPASFRKYLKERFVEKVHPRNFYFVNGENHPAQECERLGEIIADHPIDVAFVGIGENAHLAFNDPPADFETSEAFLQVDLDEACRNQQLNEGWFSSLKEVPEKAISMSIQQIMKSRHIICSVPDQRKAQAVARSLNGPVSPEVPASILQSHPSTYFFLDLDSASEISKDS